MAHDLSKLIKWMLHEPWSELVEDALAEHFEPTLQAFDLEFEEIDEVLDGDWTRMLWGVAFEDALTRKTEDGESPVGVYLTRRGWTESPGGKRYIAALKDTVPSLYEISDPKPGVSFLARDLLRGGDPVEVIERTASRTLKPWDRVYARLVKPRDRYELTGALLAFTPEGSDLLAEALREASGKKPWRGKARAPGAIPLTWKGGDEELRRFAHLFTTAWLFDSLTRAMGLTMPQMFNSDGEEIVFHEVVFPLTSKASANSVTERLNALPDLSQDSPTFWSWIGPPANNGHLPEDDGLRLNVTTADGALVLGAVELKNRTLVLAVNSAARAVRGREWLGAALGELAKPPLTEIRTIDQALATHTPGDAATSSGLPRETETQLVHELLDRQYRAVLDKPVPALGDVTPRAAVKTPAGRTKTAAWLKTLENRSGRVQDPDDPMATYDFTWMWRELDLTSLRK